MQFSIIIPVYNVENYLKKCLDSILNQSYKEFELILVDDGSTDSSRIICKEYEKKDTRVKVVCQKNQGSGNARNAGIKEASGKYCYFPDSDDILTENALETMYQETKSYDADIYVFSYISTFRDTSKEKYIIKKDVYTDALEVKKQYQHYILDDNISIQGAPWNKLFKTSIIKENNILYPDLKRHQDEVFIARYMDKVNGKVRISSNIIYKYFRNDVREEWKKFPQNYFEIRTILYDELNRIIINWNPENAEFKYLLKLMYINKVQKCFEFTFNPRWNMDNKKRKQYILKCISDQKVIEAIQFLKEYVKEKDNSRKMKLLDKFQLYLMQNKDTRTLAIMARIKVYLRKILNR